MTKFTPICKFNNEEKKVLKTHNTREAAVEELINYADKNVSYCLDTKEERMEALESRNWYVCGCGPAELFIEEVEE